jgi:hypothetical protein
MAAWDDICKVEPVTPGLDLKLFLHLSIVPPFHCNLAVAYFLRRRLMHASRETPGNYEAGRSNPPVHQSCVALPGGLHSSSASTRNLMVNLSLTSRP